MRSLPASLGEGTLMSADFSMSSIAWSASLAAAVHLFGAGAVHGCVHLVGGDRAAHRAEQQSRQAAL